jgi:hypothetical protein
MYPYKVIEKREWRKHIDKCFEVQETLANCIDKSTTLKLIDPKSQDIIKRATSKSFISEYLSLWVNKYAPLSEESSLFYNSESRFWKKNEAPLIALSQECSLFSLYECCKETYNLENLKGNYESAKFGLKTQEALLASKIKKLD